MSYFPIVLKRCRAPGCLCLATVFWEVGVGREVTRLYWGRWGEGRKSHLETRDGAEHLEFQLHHEAPKHSNERWGMGVGLICLIVISWRHQSQTNGECFRSLPPPPADFSSPLCLCMVSSVFKPSGPTCTSSQDFNSGSPSDVFCLAQLILQREEKNRLSRILPHSPFCVTGELFFAVCEMTHFFFYTKPNKRPHHNAPASSTHPPSLTFHLDKWKCNYQTGFQRC